MDQQELTGKEAYEARRAEKVAAKSEGVQPPAGVRRRKSYIWYALLAVAGVGLVYWVVSSIIASVPQTEDQSMVIADQGNSHIGVGEIHPAYNSNPPTSGPHYGQPAAPGFREEQIADEHLVHSLEHGLIWISYRPGLPEAVVNALRQFTSDSMVVITAREDNDTDIALAAWTRLDKFDLTGYLQRHAGSVLSQEEEQRIQDFITRYRNRGPEKIPPGQHGGV